MCKRDFMLPGGNLYVPGAEKLLPNIRRLTDAAREEKRLPRLAWMLSHAQRSRVQDFSSALCEGYCWRGAVPEALTEKYARVPNTTNAKLPEDLSQYQQILLEKQTLNIFESRHADELVKRLGTHAEFVVFGVVTEYCVSFAAKGLLERGRRVAVVQDAIETLKREDGECDHSRIEAPGSAADHYRSKLSGRCGAESLIVR